MQRVIMLLLTGLSPSVLAPPSTTVHTSLADQTSLHLWCPTRPTLTVWTSRACVPCQLFWSDLQSDASFRDALTTRYRMQWIDADLHREQALRAGIHALPAFHSAERMITGYQGKQWLWDLMTAGTTVDETDDSSSGSLRSDVDQVQRELTDEQLDTAPAPLPSLLRPPRTYAEPSPNHSESPEISLTNQTQEMPQESADSPSSLPNTHSTQHTQRRSLWLRLMRVFTHTAPIALTALELASLISGTAATGGVGTFALTVLWRILKRRRQRKQAQDTIVVTRTNDPQQEEESRSIPDRAPFPRQLDEARELLALRQSEGRVAVLDALRGMFLDDELIKLKTQGTNAEASIADQLQTRIDNRVDEVAPLSTTVETD